MDRHARDEVNKYQEKLHRMTSIVTKYCSLNGIRPSKSATKQVKNDDRNMLDKISQETDAMSSKMKQISHGNGNLDEILRQEIDNENEETIRLDKFLQERKRDRISMASVASSTFDLTQNSLDIRGNKAVDTPTRSILFVKNFIQATQLQHMHHHGTNGDISNSNNNSNNNNNDFDGFDHFAGFDNGNINENNINSDSNLFFGNDSTRSKNNNGVLDVDIDMC